MTNFVTISNGQLIINNVKIPYIANSLEVDFGFPVREVKGLSSGAGGTDISTSEDVSTVFGIVKFKLQSASLPIQAMTEWQTIDLNIGNIITVIGSYAGQGFTADWINMVLVSRINMPLQFGGEFELEFHGAPANYKLS